MSHLNYYVDLCVDTFVVNKGAVLLRMHEKYHFWMSAGGHVDPGEDLNQAALRETKEETGLTVELVGPENWVKEDFDFNKDLVPPLFLNRHSINEHHDHASAVFAARSTSRNIDPQEEASKDVEYIWATQTELDEMHGRDEKLRPDVYRYASAALKLCS